MGQKETPKSETGVLLDGLAGGSRDAFEELTNDLEGDVKRVIRDKKRNRPGLRKILDTGDLVQNVWATLLSRLGQLPRFGDRSEIRRYVARVAERQVTKQGRRMYAEKRDVRRDVSLENDGILEDDCATPSAELMSRERSGLSDRECRVLELRLEGRSRTEIAEILGVGEATVRRTLAKIGRKMVDLDPPTRRSGETDGESE